MSWIKRNLYFVIGSLIAVGLMVFGVFYLLSAMSKENDVRLKIQDQYAELDRLAKQNPHPGSPGKIDNVLAVKEQEAILRAFETNARPFFQGCTPIPDPALGKITDESFAEQLRNTIAQLTRDAKDASIGLPPDYYFTFEAQKKETRFEAASLDKLASHLGEIKALCDILFEAKVNAIDRFRRETISAKDNNMADYLGRKTVSTPIADMTPYEVVFRGFSTELAAVLGGLASSPKGFIVRTINVEPAAGGMDMGGIPSPDDTARIAALERQRQEQMMREREQSRYNTRPPPGAPPRVAPVPTTSASKGATILLDQHSLKVTLMVEVVKLKDTKPAK